MTLRNIAFFSALFFNLGALGQNKSVDELKGNQEIRKKYIDVSTTNTKNTSKSLFVDPFIGTGGHGHTYPGASAPFGMMQLSPDTRYEGWDGCSGYHYSDSIIYGFSHTHLSGTGVPDYCDLLIVPQNGVPKTTPGYRSPNGYGSRFSHEQENASPGYYEVKLLDQNINVRLTVSERAGMHEYTFLNKKGKKFILIDLDHRDRVISAFINKIDKSTISGYRVSESWASNQHFFFYLKTSVPYQKATVIKKNGQHKLLLTFSEKTQQILLKVGMSAVDEKGAQKNLEKEIPDWNFDALRANTVKKWNDELGKINFQTKDQKILVNFYTALYHSYLNPNLFSDVDGRYRGRDNLIHSLQINESPQYTVFSLWDTYRGTHPLFTITQQKRTTDFINTFLRQYQQAGDLPVWELAANETECMIGYHSVSVIADAFVKGIKEFDTELALKAMLTTSNIEELGKNHYYSNGYISAGLEPESVSKTLEYAYDDFCIAQFAKYLNEQSVHDVYLTRSFNFINLFDPQTKYMRARRDGMWFSPFDPSEVNFNYTEANSWQYSLYAPHAIGVLSKMIGGKDSLENWLDRLFTTSANLSGRHQVDITGLIGQYAHGNEPSHHMAYLYNYTNSPEKTQFYIDKILSEMYSPDPDGLSGNEDCGQMSSWYVLSSLGFYQVAPGNPIYDLGRPLMDEAILKLENGKILTLKTNNNSPENKYVQSVTINGKAINRSYIHHDEIMQGGLIEFTMGNQPRTDFDKFAATPTLNEVPENFVPVPFFHEESALFEDSMTISMDYVKIPTSLENFVINYRINQGEWSVYSQPIKITETSVVEAKLIASTKVDPQWVSSSTITNKFVKRDKEVSLILSSRFENQYAASGLNALIDGIQGTNEFRTGDYQGFWAQDLVAEVNFESPRILKEIGLSCIQDMKSWIFYPSSIQVEVSYDGINFEKLPLITSGETNQVLDGIVINKEIPMFSGYVGPTNQDFYVRTNSNRPIMKIRVIAKNYGKCPAWHLGAGSDTWLFADELIFR